MFKKISKVIASRYLQIALLCTAIATFGHVYMYMAPIITSSTYMQVRSIASEISALILLVAGCCLLYLASAFPPQTNSRADNMHRVLFATLFTAFSIVWALGIGFWFYLTKNASAGLDTFLASVTMVLSFQYVLQHSLSSFEQAMETHIIHPNCLMALILLGSLPVCAGTLMFAVLSFTDQRIAAFNELTWIPIDPVWLFTSSVLLEVVLVISMWKTFEYGGFGDAFR